LYYFLQHEKFYKSPILRSIDGSAISLSKGIIIIGHTGVGKTSAIKTFYSVFKNHFLRTPLYFRYHVSTEIVTEFEGLETALERKQFFDKLSKGYRYFDDVKKERIASNFGKINLFEDILCQRNGNNARTIITANYSPDALYDFNAAIDDFGVKYGYQNYDRILESYNFIELKGGSLRK
jgi:DNA replication protein DnaC